MEVIRVSDEEFEAMFPPPTGRGEELPECSRRGEVLDIAKATLSAFDAVSSALTSRASVMSASTESSAPTTLDESIESLRSLVSELERKCDEIENGWI